MQKKNSFKRTFFGNSALGLTLAIGITSSLFAQGTWTLQSGMFGGPRNKAVGFSIGNYGYVGTGGSPAGGPKQDFWEWDPSTSSWAQKAIYNGGLRVLAVGFSIGTKGYIGTGNDGTTTNYSDFWEYDPLGNSWTQKANFGGGAREWAVGFSIGSKGYVGLGWDGTVYKNDFWEYDPAGNTWISKTSFGGGGRAGAVGFSIGAKGYIGTGNMNSTYYADFWEYDPGNDTWLQKANFAGPPRSLAAGFSIGAKGYIGTGCDASVNMKDVFEWDQASDTWAPVANFSGTARQYAVGFSVGYQGYIGTGFDGSGATEDLWQFTPPLSVSISAQSNVSCNGANDGSATANASGGNPPYNYFWSNGSPNNEQWTPTATGLNGNTYTVTVMDALENSVNAIVTITEPAPISFYAIPSYINPATCGNSNGSINYVIQGGTTPYTYLWNNGQTTSLITGLSAGLYRMDITDANGCFSFYDALVSNSNGPVITVNSVTDVLCNGMSNGAIDISVTGGSLPYTYHWSNGTTTQDVSNVSYGPYEIVVTEAGGCSATQSIFVNEPNTLAISPSVINSSCTITNGSALAAVNGGTLPYNYLWSTGATTSSASGLGAGVYKVRVSDSKGCFDSLLVAVQDSTGPWVFTDTIAAANCGNNGFVLVSAYYPLAIQSYYWSTGSSTQNLTNVTAGAYGLTVTDTNGCKMALVIPVNPVLPPLKPLCVVTVDTLTQMNIVVWEKPVSSVIAGFNIYRESSHNGIYQFIKFWPYGNVSTYYDPIADPENRWSKYRIAMKDLCGHEGPLSPEHKTIHLSIQSATPTKTNLIWDDYEGYSFSNYNIFRKDSTGGIWNLIGTVAPNITVYSDSTFPHLGDTISYHIDVAAPSDCIATLKNPEPFATTVKGSKSNGSERSTTNLVSVAENSSDNRLRVFPNPNQGTFTIQIENEKNANVKVYNMIGESVYQTKMNGQKTEITIPGIANGIYQMSVITGSGTTNRKIVISR